MGWKCSLLGALLCMLCVPMVHADLRFEWRDRFSAQEQVQLGQWIEHNYAALSGLFGPMPMDMRVVFHRANSAREPVPWAHTERSGVQAVHLHVDLSWPMEDFYADWTAPHEISHLLIPYLGERSAWFAEGFASFMQYQVMHASGALSAREVASRYRERVDRARRRYDEYGYAQLPFAKAAPRLRAAGRYPTMYWGGAAYFLRVEQQLLQQGSSVLAVLGDYLACCRTGHGSLQQLIRSLDQQTDGTPFADELRRFERRAGFPDA